MPQKSRILMNYKSVSLLIVLALFSFIFACGESESNAPLPQEDVEIIDKEDDDTGNIEPDVMTPDVSDDQEIDASQQEEKDSTEVRDTDGKADTDDKADADDKEDLCGNGIIDEGETCDGNCPSYCDDRNGCTEDTFVGEHEKCTSVCTHTPIASCNNFNGEYSGNYFIRAEERFGTKVVNGMTCDGTFVATVDVSKPNHITGTSRCSYDGSLSSFHGRQTATLTGGVSADGSIRLKIHHKFGYWADGDFIVDATITNGAILVEATARYKPAPPAVYWDVDIKLSK